MLFENKLSLPLKQNEPRWYALLSDVLKAEATSPQNNKMIM